MMIACAPGSRSASTRWWGPAPSSSATCRRTSSRWATRPGSSGTCGRDARRRTRLCTRRRALPPCLTPAPPPSSLRRLLFAGERPLFLQFPFIHRFASFDSDGISAIAGCITGKVHLPAYSLSAFQTGRTCAGSASERARAATRQVRSSVGILPRRTSCGVAWKRQLSCSQPQEVPHGDPPSWTLQPTTRASTCTRRLPI